MTSNMHGQLQETIRHTTFTKFSNKMPLNMVGSEKKSIPIHIANPNHSLCQNKEQPPTISKLKIQIPTNTPAPHIQCFTTKNGTTTTTSIKAHDIIPLQPSTKIIVPKFDSSKYSSKKYGLISCYAANTNQGLIRYIFNKNL